MSGGVLVACLGLVVLIVATKVMRTRRGRTAEALVAPFRADLLAVSVGEDPDGAHLARLSAADGPARLAVDEAMVRFLGKVRGMPAEQLQEVLQKHGATKRALRQLHDRSPVHRALAAQLLGLCHEQAAVPRLVECLADPAPEVRASAVDALGRIGNPTAAPPVLAAVGAGRAVPAGAAADALEDMGVGISEALRTALADGDPTTRAVAAYLSGAGSFTRSIPGLRRLTAEDPDVTVRITAARALGRIGRSQDVEVLIRQTFADRPSELRRAGAAALGDLGEPSATQGLRALVHDDDPRLAELAASALLRLGEEGRAALTTASGAPVESALLLERLRSQVA
jgi:HEAT repeat protein